MFDNSEGEFMLNISESEKLEYLEKLESQSVSLSEDILMILSRSLRGQDCQEGCLHIDRH